MNLEALSALPVFLTPVGAYTLGCMAAVIFITKKKKYSKMAETLISIAAGFAVVFFIMGIVAVLWQAAKYMACRGMEEDEKYES